MITVFEVQDLFYKTLSGVPGKFGITGGIYKGQRPDGSLKEDIVINCLPMSGHSVQTCIVNVNIHVQDLKIEIDNVTQSVPNYKRMKEIGDQVFNLLKLKYGSDYVIYLQNQQDFRDTNNSHFYNLRLRFRKINS